MSNSNLEANEISELKDLTAEPSAKHVTKYRLDEINKIKEYFNAEIKDMKDIVKKISKYIVAFDYYTIWIVWHFKYCFICNGCWNTCRNSWSILKLSSILEV